MGLVPVFIPMNEIFYWFVLFDFWMLLSWTWTSIDVAMCLNNTSLWMYNWSNWMPCCFIFHLFYFFVLFKSVDFVPSKNIFFAIII